MLSPPDHLQAEKQGAHPLFNMADLNAFTAAGSLVMQRSFLTGNRDVVQRVVDSVVQATARIKQDKAFSVDIMKKHLKSDDDVGMSAAYDFYAAKVFPSLPFPKPEYFQEAVATLSQKNDKIKNFDINTALDQSLVQSAADRGLDK